MAYSPPLPLIPANAGTHPRDLDVSGLELIGLLQTEASQTGRRLTNWVPAFAGMSGI